jgi:hypothetical protein
MHRFVPISVLFLLVACGPIPQVDERKEHWSGEVESFFAAERTMQEVHSWLRSHNVIYTFEESDIVDGRWAMTLDKVYVENWRCEWIDIQIVVSVDDALTVTGHEMTEHRVCMF